MSRFSLISFTSLTFVLALMWASAQPRARGTQYALLIAVSKYAKADQWRSLRHTIDEMEDFRVVLTKTGFTPDNIVFLHDRQTDEKLRPTGANIFTKLDLLLQEIGPDDTLLVAFNGHGVQFGGDANSYFAPVNANLNDKQSLVAMDGKDGLYGRLEQCKARKKLLIVNACRHDPTVDVAFAAKKYDLVDKADRDPPKGTAALFSCKPGQKSYEYPPDQNRKRSFFYHHLIEAWQGKYAGGEIVTLDHVFDQVVRKTSADARNLFSEPQTPWPRRKYDGEWTLTAAAPIRPDPDIKKDKKPAGALDEIIPIIPATTREPDVIYVPTPREVVAKMLEMAKVKKEDVVYDLGCGDGRIVVDAAKKYGCYGLGVDINPVRVKDAQELVAKEKMEHLVAIRHADLFDLDISKADVIALYLLPRLNIKLLPQLRKLKPGSRVVSHDFDIEGVIPELEVKVTPPGGREHRIFLYITPLKTVKKEALKNDGKELKKYEGHTDEIKGVAFSRDGRYVASCSIDQTTRVWDTTQADAKAIQVLRGHTKQVWAVVFHPNNRDLFSASWDGTVRRWAFKSGDEEKRYTHPKDVNTVALSLDGNSMLAGCDDGKTYHWDVKTGQELGAYVGHDNFVYGVAFSSEGRYVASGSVDRTVRVFDLKSRQELKKFEGTTDAVYNVVFTSDSRYVVSSGDSKIRFWDLATGKEDLRSFDGHKGRISAMAMSHDGKRLLTGGDDRTVKLWDVGTGTLLKSFDGHTDTVTCVAFSHDGERAVSGSYDRTVRVWGMP